MGCVEKKDPVAFVFHGMREKLKDRRVNRLAEVVQAADLTDFRNKRIEIHAEDKVIGTVRYCLVQKLYPLPCRNIFFGDFRSDFKDAAAKFQKAFDHVRFADASVPVKQ